MSAQVRPMNNVGEENTWKRKLRLLLSHARSEHALVAMFLAPLELVRLQAMLLRQARASSDIFIKKHAGFDQVLNQGLTNALEDWS